MAVVPGVLGGPLHVYRSKLECLGRTLHGHNGGDFCGAILGRDEIGQFRAIDLLKFTASVDYARARLLEALERWAKLPDEEYWQGDAARRSLDFFRPVVPERRLHPSFAHVMSSQAYSPARGLLTALMHYYQDPDGNFVEQFQTTGFDARTWELYIFATFTELGYAFDRAHVAPDFLCSGIEGELFIEAVTVNPTMSTGVILETGPLESDPSSRPSPYSWQAHRFCYSGFSFPSLDELDGARPGAIPVRTKDLRLVRCHGFPDCTLQ